MLGVDSSANELLFKKPCIVPYTSEQIQNLCTTVSPVDPVIPVESYFIHVDGTRYPFGIHNTPIDNFCVTSYPYSVTINGITYASSDIASLVFGEDYLSVTTLGDSFLYYFTSLTSINLYGLSNVTAIGNNFMYTPAGMYVPIRSIDITPFSNVASIGNCFLGYCWELENITMPSSFPNLIRIPDYFLITTKISSIDLSVFPNVTSIGAGFLEGTPITSIDLSPLYRITRINERFLKDTSSLLSIDLIPLTNVNYIGDRFMANSGLNSIDLSPLTNLTTIGAGFLTGCTNLNSVNLNGLSNLATIGGHYTVGGFLSSCSSLGQLDLSPLTGLTTTGGDFLRYDTSFSTIQIGGIDFSSVLVDSSYSFESVPNIPSNIIYADTQQLGDNFKSKMPNISNWTIVVN